MNKNYKKNYFCFVPNIFKNMESKTCKQQIKTKIRKTKVHDVSKQNVPKTKIINFIIFVCVTMGPKTIQ
jgi:hypothetical protein